VTRVVALGLSLILLACESHRSPAQDEPLTISRERLFEALVSAGVLDPDRQLVHMSHTCSLLIDSERFSVIDVRELVKGSTTPRGVNQIVVLDPALRLVRTIEYTSERPLFCQENRLYVWGDLTIDNVLPEGNVLTFTNRGREVTVAQEDTNELPAPILRDRKQPPQ
jgi:hypothetical protein